MDVKLLYELKFEMDRIYIKGIRLAKNNQRITKLLPLLEKYRSEDTAYNDLLLNLKELIKPGFTAEFIGLLSNIHTSLDYLLRLYVEPVSIGEEQVEQAPVFDISDIAITQYTFLELKPLINALVGIGENRLDIIWRARKQKFFEDFRVYPYLNRALDDKDSEVVDLVETIIKDDLKDKMLPFLFNNFECDGGNGNIKRLSLLFELDYEGIDELFEEILEGDVVALQSKVIQYMSDNVAYENRIIELSESPQKLLKEVACLGLANLRTEKTERKLYELFTIAIKKRRKVDVELLVKALSQTELQYTIDDVLEQVKDLFKAILVADKKADVDHFNMLRLGISVLKQRIRPEVYDFYLDILLNETYNEIINKKKHVLGKSAKAVSYAIIDATQGQESQQLIAFYKQVIDNMVESEWKLPYYKTYLNACVRRGDSDTAIFEMFAPYYSNGYIDIKDLAILCGMDGSGNASSTIDCRWIGLLYATLEQIDEEENIELLLQLLNALEPPSSERYNQELIKAGRKTKKHLLEITSMIIKRDIKDKHEVVYSLIKYCHDQGASGSNALRQLARATYWSEFPKSYASKFRNLKNAPKAIYVKIESEGH